MNDFYLDLSGIDSREALYDYLFKTLPLPEYCGRNLDALYDALSEYGKDWRIHISGTRHPEEKIPLYMQRFKNTLNAASAMVSKLEWL